MALEHCPECTTAYSVGAPACPHCQHPTGDLVPKSFVIGPPSYAGHVDVSPEDVGEPDFRPADEVAVVEPEPVKAEAPKPAPKRKTAKK